MLHTPSSDFKLKTTTIMPSAASPGVPPKKKQNQKDKQAGTSDEPLAPLHERQQKLYERCKDYPMGSPKHMLNPGLVGASIMGSRGKLYILNGEEVQRAKEQFPTSIQSHLDELGPQKTIYLLSMFKQYEAMRLGAMTPAAAVAEAAAKGESLTEDEARTRLSLEAVKEFSSKIERELDLTKQLHDRFSKVDEENRRVRFIAMLIVAVIVGATAFFVWWVTAEPDRTRQVVMWANYHMHNLRQQFNGEPSGIPSYPDPSGFQRPTDDTPVMAMRNGRPYGIYDN